jgi:hypothetical protein
MIYWQYWLQKHMLIIALKSLSILYQINFLIYRSDFW